jgi:hypothetical protein
MAICRFRYAAKVICGEVLEREPGIAPGIYRTEVNIYNPNRNAVTLQKWLAVAIPPGAQSPGSLYPDGSPHTLGAGLALAVDCQYLWSLIEQSPPPPPPPPLPYFVGFLVIESTESVDVTAVYTTGGIRELTAPGIAVEQIKERKIASEERR